MNTATMNRVAVTTPAARNASLFGRIFSGIKVWNELRVTRNALNKLSDRELADIGLHRGAIADIGR